jgi:hypothetical protein
MNTWSFAMKLSGLAAMMFYSLLAIGQEVHVTPGKNSIILSVSAQKSYHLLVSEEKQPTLAVECAAKGKKTMHLLIFSPGEALAEDNQEAAPKSGEFVLNMTIGGNKQVTSWIPYGDTATFAYYGKTEPERLTFIQSILSSPAVSIEFKPFLTGTPVTSSFDLSKLRAEMDKHPECALR